MLCLMIVATRWVYLHGTGSYLHGMGSYLHGTGSYLHGTGSYLHGTGLYHHGTGWGALQRVERLSNEWEAWCGDVHTVALASLGCDVDVGATRWVLTSSTAYLHGTGSYLHGTGWGALQRGCTFMGRACTIMKRAGAISNELKDSPTSWKRGVVIPSCVGATRWVYLHGAGSYLHGMGLYHHGTGWGALQRALKDSPTRVRSVVW